MLRNRGVNVTERRIRHDLLRAYEYDIFDVRPRWRCIHETGCQANFYRQPRYCTTRCTRPSYFHTARSSITSYGVKRVYLPDEDWGAGSAESIVYVRNPRYNMENYYPGEAYHISGDRRYRRDPGYDGYYLRRPSSMYIDHDDCCSKWNSRHTDRKLVRKVTRKLSPILTCDGATVSNVRQQKKNNIHNADNKGRQNDLSKEAKELSLDIFKIMSLLQKVDGEDEEQFSSISLLQNIHNLDCHSSNSVANAKLITQRVNICQKMKQYKEDDPLTKFKTASGVRSKLEALLDALKQYEAEKCLNGTDSSNYDNVQGYKHFVASDPPSLEVRSYLNVKGLKSSTNIQGGKQKDIFLQTEKPKTSNKSIYGKVKLKKGDSYAERKSIKSRLSWRKKESSGIKMRRDGGNERLTDKKAERKGSFFCKTKSKSRITSIIDPEQLHTERKYVPKQGENINKAGLMIKIGGSPQRKKSATPEKYKEKTKTWIRKFVEDKKDTKNIIRIRWNNKYFYTKSSSTIVELVKSVNKQMGIDKSKSDQISTSRPKKSPKRTTNNPSKTRMQKSSKKTKYKQKVEAYMVPHIIVPGPVYTPNITNNDTENFKREPHETKLYLNECTPKCYNDLNTTSELNVNYIEIQLPKNFLDRGSTSERPVNDQQGYNIAEYESLQSKAHEDYFDVVSVDQEFHINESISLNDCEDVQVSNSLSFPKRFEEINLNINRKKPGSEPTKSSHQIAEETEPRFSPKSCCSLAKQFLLDEFYNWMPMSSDSLLWSENSKKYSIAKKNIGKATELMNDDEYIQKKMTNKVAQKYPKEVNSRRKFSAIKNNFVQWKCRITGTFSESIVGINSRKPAVLSVFRNLFNLLKRNHSPKSNIRLQDMAVVLPPETVSQPECSFKSQNLYLTRKLLRTQKQTITSEHLRLAELAPATLQANRDMAPAIPSSISKPSCSRQFEGSAEKSFEVERPPKMSLSMSVTEPSAKSDIAFTIDQPSGPINDQTVQPVVPNDTIVTHEKYLTPHLPLYQMRLVRSVHHDLDTEKNIQPKAVHSVQLLQRQIHQFNSQLLLFVRPIFYSQPGIQQTLHKYMPSLQQQRPKTVQWLSASSKCELRDIKLGSAVNNKVLKKTANNSQNVIRSVDIVIEKKPSTKTDRFDVRSKQEEAETKTLQNIYKTDKLECRKTFSDEPTNNKELVHVTQMSALENNYTYPSDGLCIMDKNAAVPFSVEVTKGDKVTKIFIKKRNSHKNNLRLINGRSSEQLVVNNAQTIKRPTKQTKRVSKKHLKLCINIMNSNTKENENSTNILTSSKPNHVFEDELPRKEVDEVVTMEFADLDHAPDNMKGCQCFSVYKSHSHQPFTEWSQIDDMDGINVNHTCITRSTSERKIDLRRLNGSITADDNSSLDSYLCDISAEGYTHDILGNADHVDYMKLIKIVEMRRTLNAIMMSNASEFAELALLRELSIDHNNTYTSLREQMKRRKKIVSVLSEINMKNIGTDYRRGTKTVKADVFEDTESSDCCSLCNILARKLNSHRCVEVDTSTNFNVSAKGDIASDYYVTQSASPAIIPYFELEGLLNCLQEEQLCCTDDPELGVMLMKSMMHSSNRNSDEKIHEAKRIGWCCTTKPNKKPKKNQTKKWQSKKHKRYVSNSNQNEYLILANANSCTSQRSSFTEYRVRFKNDIDDPMITLDEPVENMNCGVNSDILQSCKIKKAVLQMYCDGKVENEGFFVAKLPKYFHL